MMYTKPLQLIYRGGAPMHRNLFLSSPFFSDSNSSNMANYSTRIREEEEVYFVEVAVPGVKKSDITIELKDEQMNVHAVRKSSKKDADEDAELSYDFNVFVPNDADVSDGVKAVLDHGILTITLPKKAPAVQKHIEVEEIAS